MDSMWDDISRIKLELDRLYTMLLHKRVTSREAIREIKGISKGIKNLQSRIKLLK